MCGSLMRPPPLGHLAHTTQASAMTGNQTGSPLVRKLMLNLLSYASQGRMT